MITQLYLPELESENPPWIAPALRRTSETGILDLDGVNENTKIANITNEEWEYCVSSRYSSLRSRKHLIPRLSEMIDKMQTGFRFTENEIQGSSPFLISSLMGFEAFATLRNRVSSIDDILNSSDVNGGTFSENYGDVGLLIKTPYDRWTISDDKMPNDLVARRLYCEIANMGIEISPKGAYLPLSLFGAPMEERDSVKYGLALQLDPGLEKDKVEEMIVQSDDLPIKLDIDEGIARVYFSGGKFYTRKNLGVSYPSGRILYSTAPEPLIQELSEAA